MGRKTQYTVSLSPQEKQKLMEMKKDNNLSARIYKRVLIMLALDNRSELKLNLRQLAAALNTTTTIVATAKDYCEQSLDYALSHHFNEASVRTRKINGELEAAVIQNACSEAPEGQTRWTLALLTREVNKKGIAEPVKKKPSGLCYKK